MGVRSLHSLCVYVIFYVIFVPRYQFAEQGLTWWPVINVYSSAALCSGLHHRELCGWPPVPHTFDWYESLPVYYSSQTPGDKEAHQGFFGFKLALSF